MTRSDAVTPNLIRSNGKRSVGIEMSNHELIIRDSQDTALKNCYDFLRVLHATSLD